MDLGSGFWIWMNLDLDLDLDLGLDLGWIWDGSGVDLGSGSGPIQRHGTQRYGARRTDPRQRAVTPSGHILDPFFNHY